jgi:hypothetical protein
LAASQQDLSALQHPGIVQHGPDAQQFPLAQQAGAEAPAAANTGLEPKAASASPAKNTFLKTFIVVSPDTKSDQSTTSLPAAGKTAV